MAKTLADAEDSNFGEGLSLLAMCSMFEVWWSCRWEA